MSTNPNSFESYVIRGISANNAFGITEVNNLISIQSRYFVRGEYQQIENLIKEGDIESIKALPENEPEALEFKEFLEIMVFNDQNNRQYIVTVYDSVALEQDPEVIEIFADGSK